MLCDIRKNAKPKEYLLELKKPDLTSLGYIEGALNLRLSWDYQAPDRITFALAKRVQDEEFELVENPYWELCRGDYIIELSASVGDAEDERQRFLIQAPKVVADESGERKEIRADSLECEFVNKSLENYKSVSADDPDVLEPKCLRDILNGLFDSYMDGTWRVGYIDGDVDAKMRLYDFPQGNILQFMDELRKIFRCVFRFDTINRTVSAYDITVYETCPVCGSADFLGYFGSTLRCCNPGFENGSGEKGCTFVKQVYGADTGLWITDKNYIKTFEEEADFSKIVTRLYVTGKDGISIHDAADNTGGQPYLEDYSFYRNPDYMSAGLLFALDRYDETVKNARVSVEGLSGTFDFSALLKQKGVLQTELSALTKGTAEQKEVTAVLQNLLDDLRCLYSQMLGGVTEIDGKPIADVISEAAEAFETDYAKIDIAYGLDALEEASRIYQKRIDTIIEVNANTPYPDYNPNLALTDYWEKGSRFTFNLPNGDGTTTGRTVTLSYDSRTVNIPSALNYDGTKTLAVLLNGTLLKADYQYTISSDKTKIGKVGENLMPAKRRVDALIAQKQEFVSAKEAEIEKIDAAIAELNWKIAKENPDNFTKENLMELNRFIKEDRYQNTDIGVPDLTADYGTADYYSAVNQLYRDGKNAFAPMRRPQVDFTTDIVNFMGAADCQDDWNRLALGGIVHISHTDAREKDYLVRIVKIEHDAANHEIGLEITNQDNLKSAAAWFDSILRGAQKTTSIIGQNKDVWDRAEQNAVETIYSGTLDMARTIIETADNQKMTLNNRGVNLSSTLEANKGKELQLMNNILALTKDGWQTVAAAVTADGVIAEQIIGTHLWGQKCTVQATNADGTIASFQVDGAGVRIDNNTLTIRGTNENLTYDPNSGIGLVITNSAKTFRAVLNAKDGLYFQKGNGAGSWNTKPVFIDMAGNAYFDGTLRVRQLYLRDWDIEGIISGTTTGNKDKISGEYICGNYLQAIGTDGVTRVNINGNTGKIAITDGSIDITKSGVATVSLSPTAPLTVYSEKNKKFVFTLDNNGNITMNDMTANNGTFQGSITGVTHINTTGNVSVGQDIHLRQQNGQWFTTGGIFFDSNTDAPSGRIGVLDTLSPRFKICSPNKGEIEITTGTGSGDGTGSDLYLRGGNVRIGCRDGGAVMINWPGTGDKEKYKVVTNEMMKDYVDGDIEALQETVLSLQQQIDALKGGSGGLS